MSANFDVVRAVEATAPQKVSIEPVADLETREQRLLADSWKLLGGRKVLGRLPKSRLDVHEAIVAGAFPYAALLHLTTCSSELTAAVVVSTLGISSRTLSRQQETPKKPMPADLASRTWLFAETLAKATDLFGSQAKAEEWLGEAAVGLDGQRPIDLLQTVQGSELVGDFLTRLEYGVYS